MFNILIAKNNIYKIILKFYDWTPCTVFNNLKEFKIIKNYLNKFLVIPQIKIIKQITYNTYSCSYCLIYLLLNSSINFTRLSVLSLTAFNVFKTDSLYSLIILHILESLCKKSEEIRDYRKTMLIYFTLI